MLDVEHCDKLSCQKRQTLVLFLISMNIMSQSSWLIFCRINLIGTCLLGMIWWVFWCTDIKKRMAFSQTFCFLLQVIS